MWRAFRFTQQREQGAGIAPALRLERDAGLEAIGIPISIGCARLIASQLYEVKGWDPVALGGSVAALALCALVASLVPARRAATINPVRALRVE